MENNKKKLEVFFEVAKVLNEKLDLQPVLYGSLGLYKIIGDLGESSDVDMLVPREFVNEKWEELKKVVEKIGFELEDLHEHEFGRDGIIIAFAKDNDLRELAHRNQEDLETSSENGAKFKELSIKDYLVMYTKFSKDPYRKEKKEKADLEKIGWIKNYLKKTKYKMIVIRGAFVDPSVLDELGGKMIEDFNDDKWISLNEIVVDIDQIKELQKVMVRHFESQTVPWYLDGYDIKDKTQMIVAFGADDGEGGKIFKMTRGDKEKREEIKKYGVEKGIPENQMGFGLSVE